MAGFKTHITTSTVLGLGYGAAGHFLLDAPPAACALASGLCAVSGMLPDIDSDSGVPFRESMAFAAAVVPMMMVDRFSHLGLSFDYMIELLGGLSVTAHRLDPSGERPLKMAKELRRRVLRDAGRRNAAKLRSEAQDHFGLPARPLEHWARAPEKLPWRAPEGSAPSPKALVHRTG